MANAAPGRLLPWTMDHYGCPFNLYIPYLEGLLFTRRWYQTSVALFFYDYPLPLIPNLPTRLPGSQIILFS